MKTQTQDQKQQPKTIKQVNEVQGEEKTPFFVLIRPKFLIIRVNVCLGSLLNINEYKKMAKNGCWVALIN